MNINLVNSDKRAFPQSELIPQYQIAVISCDMQ